MNRPVVCPLGALFRKVGKFERTEVSRSAACLIRSGQTNCTGSISFPLDSSYRLDRLVTTKSLLRDTEIASGAIPASDLSPEVVTSADGTVRVSYKYTFPGFKNPYHNADNPCDIDANGEVNPLDALALANFLNANNLKVNLGSHDPKGATADLVDPTNNFVSDKADYDMVLGCLNG